MQITTARPQDLEEILEFIDTAFGYQAGFFREELPWQWNEECFEPHNTFIIRDGDGRLASLVRIWELHLVQNGHSVTCGGVGSVSTAAHARGKGSMTALMEHAGREMQRRGYPLAILGGDRFRYEPFGYETAGRTLNFTIEARGLKRRGIQPIESLPFNDAVLARIEATRSQMPFTVQRRSCESKSVYHARNRQVLAAGEEDFGFLVLDGGRVQEWGGETRTVLRLAAFAAQEQEIKSFSLAMPDGVPIPEELLHLISHWSMMPMCQAAIYDLEKTLAAFDAQQHLSELKSLTPQEQVWQLFGKPDAPRNIWLSWVDLV